MGWGVHGVDLFFEISGGRNPPEPLLSGCSDKDVRSVRRLSYRACFVNASGRHGKTWHSLGRHTLKVIAVGYSAEQLHWYFESLSSGNPGAALASLTSHPKIFGQGKVEACRALFPRARIRPSMAGF